MGLAACAATISSATTSTSRLASVVPAAPGELLVTDAYVGACPGVRERLVELGPVFVKGVSDPVGVWRLRDELQPFDDVP